MLPVVHKKDVQINKNHTSDFGKESHFGQNALIIVKPKNDCVTHIYGHTAMTSTHKLPPLYSYNSRQQLPQASAPVLFDNIPPPAYYQENGVEIDTVQSNRPTEAVISSSRKTCSSVCKIWSVIFIVSAIAGIGYACYSLISNKQPDFYYSDFEVADMSAIKRQYIDGVGLHLILTDTHRHASETHLIYKVTRFLKLNQGASLARS